jgi:hypothetical protein
MGLINKLKTVKKKWIYLSLGLIAVVIVGSAATIAVHERFESKDGDHNSQAYQAYYDLLRIENTDNMKLSAEQAKAILPLIEQLNKTTEEQGQADIIKNIYSNLTSQQYYSLLTENKSSENINEARGGHGEGNKRDKFEGRRDKSNVSNSALEAVVLKMLKDISA